MTKTIGDTLSRIVLFVSPLIILNGCSGDSAEAETFRIQSPDGRVEAVVTRTGGGGGSVSYLWRLYLVPIGVPVTNDEEPVLWATHVSPDPSVSWPRDRMVGIGYDKAVISRFTNIWYDRRLDERLQYQIELRLQPRSSRAF